jgi:hypothetical protein
MSRDESQRAIRVSKAVKAAIVELRLLEQSIVSPVLDRGAVDAVQSALDCRLPDDLLAAYAAHCDALRELGFVLEKVTHHTAEAHAAGCPAELVALGRGEGPVYYCISRRDADGQIHEFDPEDRSVKKKPLADWLSDLAEQRRADLVPNEDDDDEGDADAVPAELEVGKTDLEQFKPRLIAPPPASGKQVRHATFGVGDVLREIGAGASRKLEVRFPIGTKVLIARVLEEL